MKVGRERWEEKGFAEEDKVGLQKGRGARKHQTAGSELRKVLPLRHQGQWKPVQPCLGGDRTSAAET